MGRLHRSSLILLRQSGFPTCNLPVEFRYNLDSHRVEFDQGEQLTSAMVWKGLRLPLVTGMVLALAALEGCNVIVGLNNLTEQALPSDAGASAETCTSNQACTSSATLAASGGPTDASTLDAQGTVPSVCVHSTGTCAPLLSDDCLTVTGDYLNDRAIVVGSLFAVRGATATQNIPRQQSAAMAIEEINLVGGIPTSAAGNSRPLVMVSCDTSANLLQAASHLVDDLHVPAIVGPNTSQDTLDVSNNVTIKAGTVVMSPTAVAAGIADLIDKDLTWLMIPSDKQRGQLMIRQINDLEDMLKLNRPASNVKLSIIYRNDALGIGTRTSLDSLVINGKTLVDPLNAGSTSGRVQIDFYDPKQPNYGALVSKQVTFAPDIVVLAGTAETVTSIMTPLEQQWATGSPRPYYLLIDPSKGPELLALVTGNDDLRLRVRGTGTTSGPDSGPVFNAFNLDFLVRYGSSPTASGTGPSYDATYAIAYALAASKDLPISGANVASGLRRLAGGTAKVTTGSQDLLTAFQTLDSGANIAAWGTFCPLDWDADGAVKGGTIEMWCVGLAGTTPVFRSSGLSFDIMTQSFHGAYTQCGSS